VRRSGGKKSLRSSVSEENKVIIRQLLEQLFNMGNQEIADGVLAADYVDHSPSHPGLPGPENLKRAVSELRVAFPDTRNVIEDIVAEGDRVAVRWTTRATHQDEFMGIAATGNQIAVTSLASFACPGARSWKVGILSTSSR
jgi:predicted ester cyclase